MPPSDAPRSFRVHLLGTVSHTAMVVARGRF